MRCDKNCIVIQDKEEHKHHCKDRKNTTNIKTAVVIEIELLYKVVDIKYNDT